MKIKSLVLLMLICLNSAYAFQGFYMGANSGIQLNLANGHNKNSISYFNLFLDEADTTSNTQWLDQNEATITGSLFAGYGLNFCWAYVGAEGFVNFSQFHLKSKNDISGALNFIDRTNPDEFAIVEKALNTKIRTKCRIAEYGIDLKPGFSFYNCALIYGRIGVAFNQFETKLKARGSYSDESSFEPPASVSQFLPLHEQKHVAALRLGFGAEYLFYYCMGLTMDYIYTNYNDLCIHGSQNTITPYGTAIDGLKINSETSLKKHTVTIGLTYHL